MANLERGQAALAELPQASRDAALAAPLPFRRTNPHLHEWLAGQTGEPDMLAPTDLVTDALFMGLRLKDGLHLPTLSRRSGLDVVARYAPVIAEQVQLGLLELDGEQLRATPQGWWLLNRVVTAFLEADEAQSGAVVPA